VDYIAHFANELFDGNVMRCRLDLPHDLPARVLLPDTRHNIFLIIKESLNNALKHSGAKVVQLQLKVEDDRLKISIGDDGKGFDSASAAADGHRNGLGNMRRRAEAIGAALNFSSAPGTGTRVELELKFTD
jgi:signal transduction histidine kinase